MGSRIRILVMVAALAAPLASPSIGLAACGDGVLDAGEDCDDGNVLGGDCCSPSCEFEALFAACDHGMAGVCGEMLDGVCDGAGACLGLNPLCFGFGIRVRFALRDTAGIAGDRMTWRLRRTRRHCYSGPPAGDPTVDTSYSLCGWTHDPARSYLVDGVIYEKEFPAGAAWSPIHGGWSYREKTSDGSAKLQVRTAIGLKLKGSAAELPGPVSTSQYFDSVSFALTSSAGACTNAFGRISANTPTRFASFGFVDCN